MELAMAAFAMLPEVLGTTAAAAGAAGAGGWTTATVAASSLPSAIGGASTALSAMQGGVTALQMLTSLTGGIGGFQDNSTKAALARSQIETEQLASEERALQIRKDFVKAVGANRVAFGASGVDLVAGSPGAIEDSLRGERDHGLKIEGMNLARKRLALEMQAGQYDSRSALSLIEGGAKASIQGLNYGIDIAKRG